MEIPYPLSLRCDRLFRTERINFHIIRFFLKIATLAKSKTQTFYLKLGTQAPYELNLEVNNTTRRVEKLAINTVDSPVDQALLNYVDIFYLTTQ